METRARLTTAGAICLLPLLPLVMRLARLQVMEHQALETRATGQFSRSADEAIPRAEILDRNGNVLARSVPVWNCFVDVKMVADPRPLTQRLAPLVGLRPAEILRRIRSGARFPVVAAGLDYERSQALERARLEGVGLAPSQERFYPNGTLCRTVLGQVSSDGRGVSGVELAYESRLAGKARRFKVIRDGSGRLIYRNIETEGAQPQPLKLTIDRSAQYFSEQALEEAARQFAMESGVVVIEDPRNGELLALASYPPNPLKNPVVQDSYEPGSTFKVVASAAGLETGSVSETDAFDCGNGAYQITPGVVIHDHEPAGMLTLQGILEHSSNIGIAKVVERVGAAPFYRMLRSFGFGSKTGVLLPGETGGEVRPIGELSRVGLMAASYGYGVGVSALQMANAYSAIANGGALWQPRLLAGAEPIAVRRVASEETMSRLSRMLEAIVDSGTGTAARIPGYRVAGKTGTARRLDPATRRYSTTQYNASFVGYLPASAPRWTILVVIHAPKGQYYGAQVAAPVFARVAQRLLALAGLPPDAHGLADGMGNRRLPVTARIRGR